MPELPESTILVEQMNRELAGRHFIGQRVERVYPQRIAVKRGVVAAGG